MTPFTPTGPSFWRGLKCDCRDCQGKAAFLVWDRPRCGDCYRALVVAWNGKLPWKEPPPLSRG
jgi:hypothetical protein